MAMLNKRAPWGLPHARAAAAAVLESANPAREIKKLASRLADADAERRKQAADTVRRLSETRAGLQLLAPVAALLIDLCANALVLDTTEDWRTRGHGMLIAARVARTSPQRRRVAELLLAWIEASRTILRANALEGLGILAASQTDLRVMVEPVLLRGLRSTTAAERVRARDALAALNKI